MCERVGEDSRHEIGHVDIRVGIMNSLECVCLPLHEHLVGEQPNVGRFNYWACSPRHGIPLSGTGSIQEDDAN